MSNQRLFIGGVDSLRGSFWLPATTTLSFSSQSPYYTTLRCSTKVFSPTYAVSLQLPTKPCKKQPPDPCVWFQREATAPPTLSSQTGESGLRSIEGTECNHENCENCGLILCHDEGIFLFFWSIRHAHPNNRESSAKYAQSLRCCRCLDA